QRVPVDRKKILAALKCLIAHRKLQRRTGDMVVREMSVREANQNFSQLIAAAERGETIIITKNGTPVARISPQPADRGIDPQWRSAFAALEKSLRSKHAIGYRVGSIAEDDKYGGDAA